VVEPKAIIDAARTWLGTPFRHQGRAKGQWVDCIGLVIGVAKETNLVVKDFDYCGYGQLPVPTAMEKALDENMIRVAPGAERPGDVPWMSDPIYGGQPRHLGILTDCGTIIHAHSRVGNAARKAAGRVVEQRMDDNLKRRVRRYYRFRALAIFIGALLGALMLPELVQAGAMIVRSGFTMAGSYFFGPVGGVVGGLLGGFLGNLMFPEEGKLIGSQLTDLMVTSSAYGEDIADSEGTLALPGYLIQSSELKPIKHDVSGKGASASPAGYYFSYSADSLWLFRRRSAAGILRVWMQGKLRRNLSPDATLDEVIATQSKIKGGRLVFYMGAETQLPDSTMEALHGVGRVPAYRGLVTLAALDLELADYANTVPQCVAEVYDNGNFYYRNFGPFIDPDVGTSWIWKQTWNYIDDNHEVTSLIIDTNWGAMAYAPYSDPRAYYWRRFTPSGAFPELKFESSIFSSFIIHDNGAGWSDVNMTLVHAGAGYFMIFYDTNFEVALQPYPAQSLVDSVSSWVYKAGRLLIWMNSGSGTISHTFAEFDSAGQFIRYYDGPTDMLLIRESDFYVYGLASPGIGSLSEAPNSKLYKMEKYSLQIVEIWDLGVQKIAAFDVVSDDEMYFMQTGFGFGTVAIFELKNKQAVQIGTVGNVFGVNFRQGQLIYKDGILYYGQINGAYWAVTPAGVGDCVPLSQIVGDACRIAGIEETRFDVSELTDCVYGYGRDGAMSMVSWLSPLQPHYFFDPVESGGLLKFRKRGKPVAFTIPLEDLSAYEPGQEVPDRLERSQIHERALPTTVRVHYIQRDKEYERGMQHEERILTDFRHDMDVRLAESMSDNEARNMAARLLPVLHFERNELTIKLTRKYVRMEPGDPFEITL